MSTPLIALYAVVRGGIFITLLLLVGGEIAGRLVAPSQFIIRALLQPAIRRVAIPAAAILVILIAGKGALQLLSFLDPGDPITLDFGIGVLWTNPWGHAWVLQLAAAIALLLWLRYDSAPAGAQTFFTPTLIAVLVWAQTGMGHAAGRNWPFSTGRLLDAAHIGGLGIWLGTLAVLTIAAFPLLRGDGQLAALAEVVRAFSTYARIGVILVTVSGTIAALNYVRPITTIAQTTWGQLLLFKLGCMVGVLALGWYNWRIVTPALDGGHPTCRQRLRRAVRLELLLGLVMLAITTMLVVSPLPGEV